MVQLLVYLEPIDPLQLEILKETHNILQYVCLINAIKMLISLVKFNLLYKINLNNGICVLLNCFFPGLFSFVVLKHV